MAGETIDVPTEEHRDGRYFVDGEGDLWTAHPFGGWVCIKHLPFMIAVEPTRPDVKYGPYTVVLDGR